MSQWILTRSGRRRWSPTQGQECAFIAFHMYKGMNEGPYFDWVHETMKKYNGRPHWGKINRYNKDNIDTYYPNTQKFNDIRQQQDPANVFLTHYFRNIFMYHQKIEGFEINILKIQIFEKQ